VKVGVPTEIKDDEYRVALTPVGARELTEHGHEVLIERGAGEGSATIVPGVWKKTTSSSGSAPVLHPSPS
jgi:alanine dehydrogenase